MLGRSDSRAFAHQRSERTAARLTGSSEELSRRLIREVSVKFF